VAVIPECRSFIPLKRLETLWAARGNRAHRFVIARGARTGASGYISRCFGKRPANYSLASRDDRIAFWTHSADSSCFEAPVRRGKNLSAGSSSAVRLRVEVLFIARQARLRLSKSGHWNDVTGTKWGRFGGCFRRFLDPRRIRINAQGKYRLGYRSDTAGMPIPR